MVVSIYSWPDQKLDYFLSLVTVVFDHYLQKNEDFIILGDFNESGHNPEMQSSLSQKSCKNIIKKKTCFESVEGSCID